MTSESKASGELRYPLLAEYVVDRYNNRTDVLPDTQLVLERGVIGRGHWAPDSTSSEGTAQYLAALRAQTPVAAAVTGSGADTAAANSSGSLALPLISLSPDAPPSCFPYTVQLHPDTHSVQLMVRILAKALEHIRQRTPRASHDAPARQLSAAVGGPSEPRGSHSHVLGRDTPGDAERADTAPIPQDTGGISVAVLRSDLPPPGLHASDQVRSEARASATSLQARFLDAAAGLPADVAVVPVLSQACAGSEACAYSTWGNVTADVDAVRAAGAAVLVLALAPPPLLALLAALAQHGRDLLASGLLLLSLTSAPATALRWLDAWRGEWPSERDYALTMPAPLRDLAASCGASGSCGPSVSPSAVKLACQGLLYPSIRFWDPSAPGGAASEWAWNFTRAAPTAATDFNHARCTQACEDIAVAALPIDVLAHAADAAAAAGYGCYLGDADWSGSILMHTLATIRVPTAFGSLSFARRPDDLGCRQPAGLAVVDFSGVRNVRFQAQSAQSGSRYPRAAEQLSQGEVLSRDVKYNQDPQVALWTNGSFAWQQWEAGPNAGPGAAPLPAFILWSDGAVSQLSRDSQGTTEYAVTPG